MCKFYLSTAFLIYRYFYQELQRYKMYLEPRYNQCTRSHRHALTPLRFGFGSHQCAPEFRKVRFIKYALKEAIALLFREGREIC